MNKENLISLDKSIIVSRDILNGEYDYNPDIEFVNHIDSVGSFKFFSSPRPYFISCEHVGLAQMAYEQASRSFHTIVANPDGTKQKFFEPLPQGAHISDFLKQCNPDTLTWYQNKYGKPLRFGYDESEEVARPRAVGLEKSYFAATGDENFINERVEAVAQALDCATKEYVKALESECGVSGEQLKQVMASEITANTRNLYDLG